MTNIIQFPTKNVQAERQLDELMKLIAVPAGVNPKDWEEIAIPEIRECLNFPPLDKSFKVSAMTPEEAESLQNELTRFIGDYSIAVIQPAVIKVAKLYAHILKSS